MHVALIDKEQSISAAAWAKEHVQPEDHCARWLPAPGRDSGLAYLRSGRSRVRFDALHSLLLTDSHRLVQRKLKDDVAHSIAP
jgi:hypothetical protein